MNDVIQDLGGPAVVAKICKCKPPSVIGWRKRGVPADRAPALERASNGRHTVETVCPTVPWHRVPDALWPWHPDGRPLIDVARTLRNDQAASHVA